MAMVSEAMRAKAEVCYGDERCREKFGSWLTQIGLPNGLLSFQEIEECGYVKDTGFVWLKHKKKMMKKKKKATEGDCFRFENVIVSFDDEVTAFFEPNKIKNLRGVKAKEFLIWISLSEIQVNHSSSSSSGLITFKTSAGLSKSFPLSVFEEVHTINRLQGVKQADHDAKEGKKMDVEQKFNRKIYLY